MSVQAWFLLSGHVNSQNTWYLAAENPRQCVSSHSRIKKSMFGVLCQGCASLDQYFFDRTVNTEVYMNIFEEFFAQLTEEERHSFFFQQDGATCQTSWVSLQRVHDVFSEE
jgi:hypothetical protein